MESDKRGSMVASEEHFEEQSGGKGSQGRAAM